MKALTALFGKASSVRTFVLMFVFALTVSLWMSDYLLRIISNWSASNNLLRFVLCGATVSVLVSALASFLVSKAIRGASERHRDFVYGIGFTLTAFVSTLLVAGAVWLSFRFLSWLS